MNMLFFDVLDIEGVRCNSQMVFYDCRAVSHQLTEEEIMGGFTCQSLEADWLIFGFKATTDTVYSDGEQTTESDSWMKGLLIRLLL